MPTAIARCTESTVLPQICVGRSDTRLSFGAGKPSKGIWRGKHPQDSGRRRRGSGHLPRGIERKDRTAPALVTSAHAGILQTGTYRRDPATLKQNQLCQIAFATGRFFI